MVIMGGRIMKRIIIAFAAIAAAFSLVSCNKEQIEAPSTELKLNIKVANLDGSADTKAVKTAWVAGDKLNIWFDETNYTNPDLVIKYDGSEWKKDATASVSGKEPAAGFCEFGGVVDQGFIVGYWSSTPYESNNAFDLYNYQKVSDVRYDDRGVGLSVRAVLAE